MKRLSRAEQVVLIIGVTIILLLLVTGLLKNNKEADNASSVAVIKEPAKTTTKEKNVETKETDEEVNDINKVIQLKYNPFIIEAKTEIKKDVSNYIKADEAILKKVSIDFKNVNVNKLGNYTAIITYEKQTMKLPIKIEDNTPPVIRVANDFVRYTISPVSTIQELYKFVNATAYDTIDGDIRKITGWPTTVPKTAGAQTYTLQAKDKSGNIGTRMITVEYTILKREKNDAKTDDKTKDKTKTDDKK